MTQNYDHYRKMLAGEDVPAVPPQPGRYRASNGDAIAIWMNQQGKTCVLIHNRDKGDRSLVEDSESADRYLRWVDMGWPSLRAVPKGQYDAVVAGGSWPDEHEAVTKHNQAPPDDSVEAITERIIELEREAAKLIALGGAKTKIEADRAADLANSLGQLEKKADDLRRKEKEPHFKAGQDVDAKWRDPIAKAGEFKTKLKNVVLTPFINAENKRIRDEAAAEAARRQREWEDQQARTLSTDAAFHEAPPPPAPVQPKNVTVGSRGRPVAGRAVKVATIVDQDALYAHFKNNDEIKALLQRLANAGARAGIPLPGVTYSDSQVAA